MVVLMDDGIWKQGKEGEGEQRNHGRDKLSKLSKCANSMREWKKVPALKTKKQIDAHTRTHSKTIKNNNEKKNLPTIKSGDICIHYII